MSHQHVVEAARRWWTHARGLLSRDGTPSRAVVRALACAQLALFAVALVAIQLDSPAAPVAACDAGACASVPVTGTMSTGVSTDRAPGPVAGGSASDPAPASDAPTRADGKPPASADEEPDPSAPRSADADGHAVSRSRPPEATTAPTDVEEQQAPQSPPHERRSRGLAFRAQQQPETRRMMPDHYTRHAPEFIEALPALEVLERRLPPSAMTRGVPAQKAHIARLDRDAAVTVEGFDAFRVDDSRRDAFVDLPNYHERIRPELFIVHWTATGYRDVDHFVTSLKPYRVQYFLDHHARVFELFEGDDHKPAHALGANDFSQGVEIETGTFDGTRSPLFSYTADQIEQTVYLAVDFLRRNDLPVDETTLIGHYAADLIFTNPYYQPHSGELVEPKVRKFDPPQELMQVIVAKAQTLDAELGRR